jgi:epoxyqueuosine reductase
VNNTVEKVIQELEKNGCKARIISISHLPDIREDIEKLLRQGLINKRINEFYLRFQYEIPTDLPQAVSIIVVAAPQPITRTRFKFHGQTYDSDVPPTYIRKADDARVKDILTSALGPAGCGISRARLPLKTLAVRSGLAQYGRNNITYVPGFGSFFRLAAYYTDCPTETDNWQELKVMKACENCFKCLENCPTQCIPTDRFLIHPEKCLTWLNEITDDFPDWVKPEWHNAVIGCMRCQEVCPVDSKQIDKVNTGPEFSEEETELILNKISLEKMPESTRIKLLSISADDWYDVIARNLKVLIQKS